MRIRRAVVFLALVGATACKIERTPRADPGEPVTVARAEIVLTLRDYQEALLAADPRRAAAVFTPTAQLFLPDMPEIHGRGSIDEWLADRFANERVVEIDMELHEIDVAAGVAHQFGRFQQRVRHTQGDEQEIDGRFAIRWIRAADAAWRIERLMLNYAPGDSAATPQS